MAVTWRGLQWEWYLGAAGARPPLLQAVHLQAHPRRVSDRGRGRGRAAPASQSQFSQAPPLQAHPSTPSPGIPPGAGLLPDARNRNPCKGLSRGHLSTQHHSPGEQGPGSQWVSPDFTLQATHLLSHRWLEKHCVYVPWGARRGAGVEIKVLAGPHLLCFFYKDCRGCGEVGAAGVGAPLHGLSPPTWLHSCSGRWC